MFLITNNREESSFATNMGAHELEAIRSRYLKKYPKGFFAYEKIDYVMKENLCRRYKNGE